MRFSRHTNRVEPDIEAESGGAVAVMDPPVTEEPASRWHADNDRNILQRILQFEITQKKVPRKELMHFSRQMSAFVRAGIPLLEALESIAADMGSKQFRAVVLDVGERVASGLTLTDACAAHPEAFPNFYVGMLRTAELSGRLDHVLTQLAGYIERDLDARRKVTSALIYPAIIAIMGIVVIGILLGFVLPRFRTFFDSLDAKLPLPTRILLSVSNAVSTYWYVLVGLLVLFVLVSVWMRQSERGRRMRDKMLLKVPALGDLLRHVLVERFCRIMSAMITAGVPLPEAMQVTSDATNNTVFRSGLQQARETMLRGGGLAAPLAESGLFPSAAQQMLRVGEDTGTLDDQLSVAADYYGRELEYKIKNFTNLFEPAVIVVMGALVGFVAIALVSAMYGIFRQVHP
jgi:type IV pilus assembly protein PilC